MSKLTKLLRSWWLRRQIRYSDAPLADFVAPLERGEPYSFTRFGDGEWYAILGDPGANADGHEYFPALGADLRRTLEQPRPYRYGMQPSVMGLDGLRIGRYLKGAGVDLPWCNANVFHYANRDGRLWPLIREVRRRPVVMIGPAHLRALDGVVFPIERYIEIPALNCYLALDRVRDEVAAAAEGRDGVVFAFAASMMTNVIVHDLYSSYGKRHWMLDFGSVLDVYAGVQSRSVYRDLDWSAAIARNLGNGPSGGHFTR